MARKLRIDMVGVRFGRLVGVSFSHTSPGGRAQWLFACDCGEEVVADGGNVRRGSTASCGCLHREICAARLTIHGRRAGRRHDATYRAWQLMNLASSGITGVGSETVDGQRVGIDPAWAADFTAFLADMGERPANTVLVRLDPSLAFTMINCRWAAVRDRAERAAAGHRRRRERDPLASRRVVIPVAAE